MHKRLMVAALKALGRGTKFVPYPPIFEPSEHVFHFVALLVEEGVIGMATFRLDFDGMQTAMPRFARAARNQSAS